MRSVVGAVVLAGMLALSGCVEGDPIPTLPPTPSSTPIFASEEEALAAAEVAYAAYLETSSLISSEGGTDPERIEMVAARELQEASLEGFSTLRENQWRTVGSSTIRTFELQYVDLSVSEGGSEEVLVAYVCVDFSAVDVVDAEGASVVSPDRPDLQAFEVLFDVTPEGVVVPADRDVWDADQVCGSS
jgi:hypothetical protein